MRIAFYRFAGQHGVPETTLFPLAHMDPNDPATESEPLPLKGILQA
jgi:hypothetical protein